MMQTYFTVMTLNLYNSVIIWVCYAKTVVRILTKSARPEGAQQGTAFSAVLYKNYVTDWPTSFFCGGKRSALFCCRGRIEIKYLFSWLLQNNILGVEVLFEIQKPRLTPQLFYLKQHFETKEAILQQTRYRLLYFLNSSVINI